MGRVLLRTELTLKRLRLEGQAFPWSVSVDRDAGASPSYMDSRQNLLLLGAAV